MFDALTSDAIFLIFDILPLSTLVILRCTCRSADLHFTQHVGNRLRNVLQRFTSNIEHFLQEMSSTNTVIGGSAALAVAGRCTWIPRNLDLYTPKPYFAHLVSYLVEVEHYQVSYEHLTGGLDDHIEDVRCFILRLRSPRGETVDVMRSPGLSPLQPLSSTWTTGLLCFVSATSLSVAYPFLADTHRGVLRPARLLHHIYPADRVLRLVQYYESRGFSFRTRALSWEREANLDADCAGPTSAYCPLTLRFFGDKHTVTTSHLSLGDKRPIPPPRSYLDMLTTAWWEGGHQCGGGCIGHPGVTEPQQHVLGATVLPLRIANVRYVPPFHSAISC